VRASAVVMMTGKLVHINPWWIKKNIVAYLMRLRVYKEFHIRLVNISLTYEVMR